MIGLVLSYSGITGDALHVAYILTYTYERLFEILFLKHPSDLTRMKRLNLKSGKQKLKRINEFRRRRG